ncbi:MAG TPA: HlyD family secretion protein [Methylomirabilota bacterium]|jgi:membrane fusion protein (multidrug efflux system)|nr:HlyD family secretion protein [Methylomirabilota bacterium]
MARRRLLPVAITLAVLAAAAYGTWTWLAGRHRVSTEDAYVEGSVVIVSARIPGPVAKVHVRDNEDVRPGQLLVEIDPRDAQIRVEQTRAAVAMATAEARGARSEIPLARESTDSRLQQARATLAAARVAVEVGRAEADEARARAQSRRAATAAAQAEVALAESTTDRTQLDLDRASRLVTGGLISQQEHDAARSAHRSAVATLDAARRRLAQAERETEGADAEIRRRTLSVQQAERRVDEAEALVADAQSQQTQVPVKEAAAGRAGASVEQAQADLAAAELQLTKTRVVAPVAGMVSKKTVEPGQMVQAGQPLLAIVPLEGVWVVANLKETQVGRVRAGQPVTVRVDTFPDRVFRGRVDSISAGTGSRFSLLPPENASGNWVKVVQRVPVKILLEDYHANPHLLRAGMSAVVTIDVR